MCARMLALFVCVMAVNAAPAVSSEKAFLAPTANDVNLITVDGNDDAKEAAEEEDDEEADAGAEDDDEQEDEQEAEGGESDWLTPLEGEQEDGDEEDDWEIPVGIDSPEYKNWLKTNGFAVA